MEHTVTATKQAITWDEFVASKDITILSDYPECANMTLEEVCTQGIQNQIERQKNLGLISYTEDPVTGAHTTVWKSEMHFELSKMLRSDAEERDTGVSVSDQDGNPVLGPNNKPLKYTAFGYLQYLFSQAS